MFYLRFENFLELALKVFKFQQFLVIKESYNIFSIYKYYVKYIKYIICKYKYRVFLFNIINLHQKERMIINVTRKHDMCKELI